MSQDRSPRWTRMNQSSISSSWWLKAFAARSLLVGRLLAFAGPPKAAAVFGKRATAPGSGGIGGWCLYTCLAVVVASILRGGSC